MQRSGAVVARQPARDQPLRVLARAGLVHGVRERMSGVRVTGPQLVAALRQGAAERYVAVLRMGPAAVIEEPPVVRAEVPGVALAEITARPVVLRPPGDGAETEGAAGQRHA